MLSCPKWSSGVTDVHHPIFKSSEGHTGSAEHGAFANRATRAHESISSYPGERPDSDGPRYQREIRIIDIVGARAKVRALRYQRPLSKPYGRLIVAFDPLRD
jgi:hypothetical protein